jgi:hypothetical protein
MMAFYHYEREVLEASGWQTGYVEADSMAEAKEKFAAGDYVFLREQLEADLVGPPMWQDDDEDDEQADDEEDD